MNKDWEGGARVLKRYLSLDPKNVRGREMLAWALEADGDLKGELEVRRSLAEDVPTPIHKKDYGRALERAANFRAASLQYHAALADTRDLRRGSRHDAGDVVRPHALPQHARGGGRWAAAFGSAGVVVARAGRWRRSVRGPPSGGRAGLARLLAGLARQPDRRREQLREAGHGDRDRRLRHVRSPVGRVVATGRRRPLFVDDRFGRERPRALRADQHVGASAAKPSSTRRSATTSRSTFTATSTRSGTTRR